MLWLVTRERLEQMSRDEEFLKTYDDAVEGLDAAYAAKNTWMARRFPDLQNTTIAYFSAEFAIHQSLPIYAGGLGVLAGDHCKESSDLGVPLVGVGFMYPQGYFHQTVSPEGWQLEVYERLNWPDVAIEQALKPDGSPCIVAVPLGDRAVLTNVWKVARRPRQPVPARHGPRRERAAGSRSLRAPLRRRSRNAPAAGNHSRHRRRARAARARHRAGGVASERRARGLRRAAAHLRAHRRGHELRRGARGREGRDDFHDAHARGRRPRCVSRSIGSSITCRARGGRTADHRGRFLALGEYHGQFNMTALALRSSDFANGVSRLHGDVTRQMWEPLLQEREKTGQRPLTYITNGVHMPTWLSLEIAQLFERYLGADWRDRQDDAEFWNRVLEIPDEALWNARTALKRFLFTFIRQRARDRWAQENVSAAAVVAAGPLLDPGALTIGFARRFTAYKRPELIFRDPDRLIRLLSSPAQARADRLCGQGASGRRRRQASSAADLSPRDRPDLRRTHRLRRRLRSARRAFPVAGLRRVAQHAAQAARSQRHERHEGRPQRRAAPEHRRRMVGRGIQRLERLGHRRRQGDGRSRRAGCGRRRRALSPARRAGRADLLSARPARRAARVAAHREGVHPHGDAAILRARAW